jgi:hypothetical protein
MPIGRTGATVAVVSALSSMAVVNLATAHATPLPSFCVPPDVVGDVCTARLQSVTADVINGTITGTPVDGGSAVTLAGYDDAYLKSTGFGDARPDVVQRWDDTIDGVNGSSVDASDPNWYGNAKSRAFLPRTLNDLAAQFPPDVLVVRFTPGEDQSGSYRLESIQPTSQ